MFERFLCSLLNDSFGDFIIGIDKDQLQFSLWNGHIAVENVEFRPTALNILLRSLFPLPLMIVHACARSLSVHLHWRQLKHEPIWIKLKGLNLVVKLGRNYGKELNTEHTTSTTPNSSPSVKESGQGVGEQGEQQDQGGGQGEEQIEEEKQELIHVEAKAIEHEAIQRKIEILKDEEEALINAVMFAMDEDNRMGDAMGEGGSRVQGAGRGGDYQFRSRKTTMTEKLLLAMLQALHIQVEDIRIQFELDIPINKSSLIPPSSSERMEEGERNTKQAATSSQLIPIHPATISVLLNIGSLSMVNTASIENGMERNVLIHKECKIRDITISVHANKLSHTRSPRSLSPDLDSICSSFIVQPFSTTLKIACNGDLNAMRGEFLLDISEIIALLSPASAFVVSLFAHEFMDAYDAMEKKIVHIVHNQRHGTDAERKEYIYLYKSTLNAMWTQKLTEDNYKRMHQLEKEISLADLRLYRRSAIAELKVELPVGQYVVRRSSIEEPVRHWYDSCLWGGVDDSAKDPDIMLTEDDRERIFSLLAREEAANPAFKQHPPATADTTASLSADSNSPVALSSLPSEIGEGAQQVLFNPQPSDPSIYASRLFVATALAETVSSSTMTAASLSQPMQRAILRIGLTIPSVWVALCEEASPFTDLLPNAVQDMEKILTNNVTILSAANFYTPLFDAISIGLARPHFARIALDFSGVQANINFDYGLIDTNIQVKGVHLMQTAPSEPANREPIKSDFILAIGNLEALRRERKSQTSNALEIRMLYKNNTDGGSPSSLPDAFNGDMIINPIHLSLNSAIFFSMQIAKRFIAANEVARLCTLFRTVVLAQPARAKANLSEEQALPRRQ